jgi:hypothetical protein
LVNGRQVQFDLSVIVTGVVGFFVGAAVVFLVTVLGYSKRLATYPHARTRHSSRKGELTKFMTQNGTTKSTNRQARSTSSKQLARITILLLLLLLLGVFTTTISPLVVVLGRVPRRRDRSGSIVVTTTARLLTTTISEVSGESPLRAAGRCLDEEGAASAGLPFLDPADGERWWGVLRGSGGGRSAGVGRAGVVGWAAVLIIGRAFVWRAPVFVVGRAIVGGTLIWWALIRRTFAAAAAVVGG